MDSLSSCLRFVVFCAISLKLDGFLGNSNSASVRLEPEWLKTRALSVYLLLNTAGPQLLIEDAPAGHVKESYVKTDYHRGAVPDRGCLR